MSFLTISKGKWKRGAEVPATLPTPDTALLYGWVGSWFFILAWSENLPRLLALEQWQNKSGGVNLLRQPDLSDENYNILLKYIKEFGIKDGMPWSCVGKLDIITISLSPNLI